MSNKSILLVMFIILSMLFFTSCSREERTLEFSTDYQYDFVFALNIASQNEFEGDVCYNFMGGPVSEIYLVRVVEPDVIVWRVVTLDENSQPFNGIVTPYAHDKLWYPIYVYTFTDQFGVDRYRDCTMQEHLEGENRCDESSGPIEGMVRTHSIERRLEVNVRYLATAKRINGQTSNREFVFLR